MKNATLYLTTPLLSDEENSIPASCYKIKGSVLEISPSGILFHATALGSESGWDKDFPSRDLFIPQHKIDFIDSQ